MQGQSVFRMSAAEGRLLLVPDLTFRNSNDGFVLLRLRILNCAAGTA